MSILCFILQFVDTSVVLVAIANSAETNLVVCMSWRLYLGHGDQALNAVTVDTEPMH